MTQRETNERDALIAPPGAAPSDADAGTHVIRKMRRQLVGAVLIAAISVAAAVGSILGQGIAYRQMRAIETIAQRCGGSTR